MQDKFLQANKYSLSFFFCIYSQQCFIRISRTLQNNMQSICHRSKLSKCYIKYCTRCLDKDQWWRNFPHVVNKNMRESCRFLCTCILHTVEPVQKTTRLKEHNYKIQDYKPPKCNFHCNSPELRVLCLKMPHILSSVPCFRSMCFRQAWMYMYIYMPFKALWAVRWPPNHRNMIWPVWVVLDLANYI